MSIDVEDASAALGEIDVITRRVRQSQIYRTASLIIPLWGILSFFGYLVTFAAPRWAATAWTLADLLGVGGTVAITFLHHEIKASRNLEIRMLAAYAIVIAFGLLWTMGFGQFSPRALSAFWPTYFMMGYTLVGLWLGTGFIVIGAAVTVLTIGGFFLSGDWFSLWMAFIDGGGLVLGGLWMRRN